MSVTHDPGPHPAGEFVLTTGLDAAARMRLSRAVKAGRAAQLAKGIYLHGGSLPIEQRVRHHLHRIVAALWPGAVICDRSALNGGQPVDGALFIAQPKLSRASELRLPGVAIVPRIGPGPLPGDMPMPEGLHLSGPVRQLIENVPGRGRPNAVLRTAGIRAVEDKIEEEARVGGAGRIRSMLTQLDLIQASFTPSAVEKVRERLAAVLGTTMNSQPESPRLSARLSGRPYDQRRLDMLTDVLTTLSRTPPAVRPALGGPARWAWEPFFEAYFSNFIEGTRFDVEEARQIAVEGVTSQDRPEDAHDVAATYRIVADPELAAAVPHSGDDLLEMLKSHHELLMASRPVKRPGCFKERQNYAGGYAFVAPEAVVGTLIRGFEQLGGVTDPFQRAVAMMLLLTEVHPFDDGNGRLARILVNAELSHGGQIRIVIPTSYRNDYLAGLNAVSNGAGKGQSLISVLEFAQRWTGAIDWASFEMADQQMKDTNAYVDAGIAERSGQRLKMPD